MALSKLTKVQTLGIGSNIEVVGVITTGQFKSGTSNLHSSGVELTNLNVSGIATIGGNVSIGGTLTYQDVTNIDSVGIITARSTIDAQGSINLADSIIHTGDTDTKIRFPAADTITAETGGSERLRITSAGQMGLGTNDPNSYGGLVKLAVANTSGTCGLSIVSATNGDGNLYYADGTSGDATYRGYIRYNHTLDQFRIGVAGAEKLRIASDGVATFSATNINVNRNAGDAFIALQTSGSDNVSLYGGATTGFRVFTKPSGGSLTERLRIDSNGRLIVGGGTHAGGSALVVKGGNQNTYSTIGMFSNHTNPAVNTLITQIRFGSNVSAVGADIRAEADADWGNNDYPTRLGFYTTPDGSNSRSERLRITKDGQIRIDQATSANNGIRIRPSGWNYDFRIGAVSSSGGSIWLGQNYEPTGGTRDSASYGTNYIQFTTGGTIHFGTGATNTNPTARMNISSEGYVTKPNMPIASLSDGGATDVTNAVLTSSNFYNHTWVNQGSHFNASNGRFTCPVAGVYRIYFRATTDQTQHTNVRLRRNGSTINEAYANGDTGTTHSDSSEAVVNCSANDYLEIQASRLKASHGTQHKQVTFQLLH